MNKSAQRVVLVAYHLHTYPGYRPTMMHRYLLGRGADFASYECLAADWDHFKKQRQSFPDETKVRLIEVPAYNRNISFARSWSYFIFALKVLRDPSTKDADLIVVCVPPNIVALLLTLFLRSRKKTSIVVDVVDLWPDALPLSPVLKSFVMATLGVPWVFLRNLAYKRATRVLSHCRFFLEKLGLENNAKASFIPLYQFDERAFLAESRRAPIKEALSICVLGSVNNVLDADSLVDISRHLISSGPGLRIEILGAGESKPRLVAELKSLGVEVVDHGTSYDPVVRTEILTRCHFGYNGYKSTTAIGITYKSIDFSSYGLPILNSVSGDLKTLVSEWGCGFHYEPGSEAELATRILALGDADYSKMSRASRALAEEYFRKEAFEKRWDAVLESL